MTPVSHGVVILVFFAGPLVYTMVRYAIIHWKDGVK